jgi:Pup-ligase protein.
MFDDAAVQQARDDPPTDTRAYFRGRCMSQYPETVAAASWDSVVFDLPERDTLLRVPTLEPTRGTKDHVGDLLDASTDASALIDALTEG